MAQHWTWFRLTDGRSRWHLLAAGDVAECGVRAVGPRIGQDRIFGQSPPYACDECVRAGGRLSRPTPGVARMEEPVATGDIDPVTRLVNLLAYGVMGADQLSHSDNLHVSHWMSKDGDTTRFGFSVNWNRPDASAPHGRTLDHFDVVVTKR